jgi:hypothetical protein
VAAALEAPRGRGAHPAIRIVLAALAILLLAAWAGRAEAQIFASSTLCDTAGTCGQQSVAVGQIISYRVTIDNHGGPSAQVNLAVPLPPGFVLTAVACTTDPGNVAQSYPLSTALAGLDLPADGEVVCSFTGSFQQGSTTDANIAPTLAAVSGGSLGSGVWNAHVDLAAKLPSDLEIVKTGAPASLDLSTGPKQVTYTIRVTNLGSVPLNLRDLLTVQDRLQLGAQSVVLYAKFVSATCKSTPPTDCLDPVPSYPNGSPAPVLVASSAPVDFLSWRYPTNLAGYLPAGGVIELEVVVEVSQVAGVVCVVALNSDGLQNTASLLLTLPATAVGGTPTALAETSSIGNPSKNNTSPAWTAVTTGSTVVNPACNAEYAPKPKALSVLKEQITPTPAGGVPWGSPIEYQITITNVSTNRHVRAIVLSDWVREGIGTPPFRATVVSVTCPFPGANTLICNSPHTYSPQALAGYSDMKKMYDAKGWFIASGLQPGQKLIFRIVLAYSNPGCDSYPGVAGKPIDNIAVVTSWKERDAVGMTGEVVMTTPAASIVTTQMAGWPACGLKVLKSGPSGPIEFGKPITYKVAFSNPTGQAQTMGTLLDVMRYFAPPGATLYAAQLAITYKFNCFASPANSVSGYPANNPSGPGGTDTVFATATDFAQQGVPLIHNGANSPVVFAPNASLQCKIEVIVAKPPESDPNCSTGFLQNAAILDSSALYDRNIAWPPNTVPGMWAEVHNALPRCYDVTVDKTVKPGWTWSGGGPLTWTMSVLNSGSPIGEVVANAPAISDTFSTTPATFGPATVTPGTTGCPLGGCQFAWAPPPANPSYLRLIKLPKPGTATARFIVNPAPNGTGLICNVAVALPAGIHSGWFWKHPNAKPATSCAKVLETGSIQIGKLVKNNTGGAIVLPVTASFKLKLVCTYPDDPTGVVIPAVVRSLAATATSLVERIPVGSQCSVEEYPPAVPAGTPSCAPEWTTTYSPSSAVVPKLPAIAGVTATNVLTCRPTKLVIVKTIDSFPNMAPPPALASFLVNCGPLNTQVVQAQTNGKPKTVVVTPPATCTVTEYVPASATGGCIYSVTQTPAGAMTLSAGATLTITFHNDLICGPATVNAETAEISKLVRINGAATPVSPALLPFAGTAGFAVSVKCTGYPAILVVIDASTGFRRSVGVYPAGTQCTFREVARPYPHACNWVSPYPPPQSVTLTGYAARLDIINSITCPP